MLIMGILLKSVMSDERTPIAAGFRRLGGHNGSKFVRIPKEGLDHLELDPGDQAHVAVYDDGSVEIDFEAESPRS